jgi:hypothetical protein
MLRGTAASRKQQQDIKKLVEASPAGLVCRVDDVF